MSLISSLWGNPDEDTSGMALPAPRGVVSAGRGCNARVLPASTSAGKTQEIDIDYVNSSPKEQSVLLSIIIK